VSASPENAERRRATGSWPRINGGGDAVNHPAHYNAHPSGIECIEVVEHMGFNVGNAIKYLWRADLKGNALEDLQKAAWYVEREIEKRRRKEESAAVWIEPAGPGPAGGER
jgi:hypothetical protein